MEHICILAIGFVLFLTVGIGTPEQELQKKKIDELKAYTTELQTKIDKLEIQARIDVLEKANMLK